MKALLKAIHSPDVPDLATHHPNMNEGFCILLQLMVGPENIEGAESFDVLLCNSRWLENECQINGPVFGSHYLIIVEYKYEQIYNKIKNYIESIVGENWDDLAVAINKIGRWEFDDYHP